MKIHSMGDGIWEDSVDALKDKPCIVLVADTRDELATALAGIGLRDDVTVVRAKKKGKRK